jgi:ZIP family zinc transporter
MEFGAVGWGLVVAASLIAGALVAVRITLPERVAATVSAFGGGVLLGAVALELVPEADQQAGLGITACGMLAGTVVFVGADFWLSRRETTDTMRRSRHAAAAGRPMMVSDRTEAARGQSIAAGIVVDGIPESIALGLTVADRELGVALLVGVLVGNVIEAYGAVQPIHHSLRVQDGEPSRRRCGRGRVRRGLFAQLNGRSS